MDRLCTAHWALCCHGVCHLDTVEPAASGSQSTQVVPRAIRRLVSKESKGIHTVLAIDDRQTNNTNTAITAICSPLGWNVKATKTAEKILIGKIIYFCLAERKLKNDKTFCTMKFSALLQMNPGRWSEKNIMVHSCASSSDVLQDASEGHWPLRPGATARKLPLTSCSSFPHPRFQLRPSFWC